MAATATLSALSPATSSAAQTGSVAPEFCRAHVRDVATGGRRAFPRRLAAEERRRSQGRQRADGSGRCSLVRGDGASRPTLDVLMRLLDRSVVPGSYRPLPRRVDLSCGASFQDLG